MKSYFLSFIATVAIATSHAEYKFSTVTNETTGAKITSILEPDGSQVTTATMVTNIVSEVAPKPGNYEVVSNAAMIAAAGVDSITNAFQTGFTEWEYVNPGEMFEILSSPEYKGSNRWELIVKPQGYSQETWSADGGPDAVQLNFSGGIIVAIRVRIPTMADISGCASTNDVVLTPVYSQTPTFSEWEFGGIPQPYTAFVFGYNISNGMYSISFSANDLDYRGSVSGNGDEEEISIQCRGFIPGTDDMMSYETVTANRTRTDIIGYTLGSQTNDVLASTNIIEGLASTVQLETALVNTTNEVSMVDLISDYGIVSAISNELEQMEFTGVLLTNRLTIAYDSGWGWKLYSGDSTDIIESGSLAEFTPFDTSTVISLSNTAQAIYGTNQIVFRTGLSGKTTSGLVKANELTTIVYDDATDWMSLYFKKQIARYYPNSNQVARMVTAAVPTKVSQLTNDSEYVTKSVTNGLASTTWVGEQGYVTESVTNGLASTEWVNGKGYVTESVTNGLASTSWVGEQGYVTEAITNGLATTEDLLQKAPATNIQKEALSQAVQDSLNKADNALSRTEAENGMTEWNVVNQEDVIVYGTMSFKSEDNIWTWIDRATGKEFTAVGNEDDLRLTLVHHDGEEEESCTANRTRLPTMADIPTDNAQLANGAGYVTNTDIEDIEDLMVLSPIYDGNGKEFSDWVFEWDPRAVTESYNQFSSSYANGQWTFVNDAYGTHVITASIDATNLSFSASDDAAESRTVTATRTPNLVVGYTLGSQTNIVLATTNQSSAVSVPEIYKEVSWTDLKAQKDIGQLIPGISYRITNYVASSNGDMNSHVVAHPFDLIVMADSTNKVNEVARAVRHNGDVYFPSNTKFESWKVNYCLENDESRFAWATNTGCGVVYRLIDEFNNDVPYDFKGIQFLAYGDTDNVYRYTFDSGSASDNTDSSLAGGTNQIYGNHINPYTDPTRKIKRLNGIVFKGDICYSNRFGNDCYSNTFGSGCNVNTFGNSCNNITFGDSCQSNIFGDSCQYIIFGTSANLNSNYRYITIENGNRNLYLDSTGAQSASDWYQNVTLRKGINNTAAGTYVTITDTNINQTVETTFLPKNSIMIEVED